MSISFSRWNDKTEMVATGVESCRGKFEEIFEFEGGEPTDDVETSGKISHQASVLKGRTAMCNLVRLRRSTYERFLKPGRHLVKDR